MNSTPSIDDRAQEAAAYLKEFFDQPPRFGIILGTGSGVLAQRIENVQRIEYQQIPNFPASTAMGHAGEMICGTLESQPVIALNGRFHLYEGHSLDKATLAVRVMKQMGVEFLIVTNASGGVNPKFKSGEIMIINSHLDLMFRSSPLTTAPATEGRPGVRTDAYDHGLAEIAKRCARQNDFVIHSGVYGGMMGPNYETRAEYRMLRRIGVDVAGMSTIPEVNLAAILGMRILGLSIVSNVAKPDVLAETSGQEVIDAAELAAPRVYRIVQQIILQQQQYVITLAD